MPTEQILSSSFRDPAGFLFRREGTLYRQVNPAGREDYDLLMRSGLYAALTDAALLIRHTEEEPTAAVPASAEAYRILRPEIVPFISYPYEWCFSQLQDAALTTLQVQKRALEAGMSLKDASAYNIQFQDGKPILIDTLSLERYREGEPWPAYRQFCEHFLAPLALMALVDVRLSQLLRVHIDGIPLDLTSTLLPGKTRLRPGLLTHLHLHAAAQRRYGDKPASSAGSPPRLSRTALLGLIDSLEGVVRGLSWKPAGTEWADYYSQTNYSDASLTAKERLVAGFLEAVTPTPETVWDLGANTGRFSRLASARGIRTISWDVDPAAVEQNYRECRRAGETRLLPLVQDLTNPSPALGWAGRERSSFGERGRADVVFALALIHHLAITNNVPLGEIARFFAETGEWLIIEFVPAEDSQAQRLLARRAGVFPGYTRESFEAAFGRYFTSVRAEDIPDTRRRLYLLRKGTDDDDEHRP